MYSGRSTKSVVSGYLRWDRDEVVNAAPRVLAPTLNWRPRPRSPRRDLLHPAERPAAVRALVGQDPPPFGQGFGRDHPADRDPVRPVAPSSSMSRTSRSQPGRRPRPSSTRLVTLVNNGIDPEPCTGQRSDENTPPILFRWAVAVYSSSSHRAQDGPCARRIGSAFGRFTKIAQFAFYSVEHVPG